MEQKGVLVDLTLCTGCRGCQVACKQWNERAAQKRPQFAGDFTNPVSLSADCYTRIRFVEGEKGGQPAWSFVKDQCLHCKEPACASACPVGALTKTPAGPVAYDFDRCIGCRYCLVACPFGIPKYEWDTTSPWVQKCTFCSERIADGLAPACIKTCPSGALYFDDHGKVVAEAERRIKEGGKRYVPHVFGKEEAGGTNWIYISDVPFDQLGFRTRTPKVSLPSLTWDVLSSIPLKAGGIIALLGAVAYLRNRNADQEVSS